MKTKALIILSMFLWSMSQTIAQGPSGGMEMPTIGIISGKVVDDKGSPVEYATVSLFSMRDSSLLTGGITDKDGAFKLSELKLGVYWLDIKFLGFEHKQIRPIYLFPKGRGKGQGTEQNFGEIKLENSSVALEGVNVVADKSHVQYQIDKKVVNVSQDISSASGSAVEVLQNVPSVSVDIDGNVEMRGSSSFTVLIDGKPSVLEGSEALQQIPANMIENIEIITNPSAKFDPDGSAGIINVILKKKKKLGLNGIVNLSAGTNDKYSGNVNLSYKTGKLGFTFGFDYRDEKRYGNGKMETISKDTVNFVDYYSNYDGTRNFNRGGIGFQAGIDYYINDKNTLSLSGRYGDRDFNMNSQSWYYDYTRPATFNDYYMRENKAGFGGNTYNINLNYALKFNKPQQKLDLSVYYSKRGGTRADDQFKYFTDENRNILNDVEPELNKADETGPREEYRAKADFSSPLGENGFLEAGYQARYEIDNEEFIYSTFNSTSGNWDLDPVRSNKVDFNRNIQAVYSTYANKIFGLDYKIGLRGEYTNRYLFQINQNEKFVIDRFDLFPSAYITKQLNKKQQIQLNYSRRIDRPGGRQLDPFANYSNPKRIRKGNPYLEPEYVDSYELNFQQQFNKSFVALETYYRKTNNVISRFEVPIAVDTTVSTYKNLNHDNSLGVELNMNLNLTKWWRLNAGGTGYYYQILGELEGEDIDNETFTYNFRANSMFTFAKNTKVQINVFYRGPSISAQGSRKAFFFSNLAVRQDLLKNKLTLTAQLQDVFGVAKFGFTNETPISYSSGEFSREGHVVKLSLTYRINNFKQKRSGRNGNGDGGEEMDMNMDM
jgi:outer membrane receptor protein involved in Fe transport